MKTLLCSLPGLWRGHILKHILVREVVRGCLTTSAKSAFAQNWTTTTAPVANWVSVASSADGNKRAALVQNGGAVYTSTNAGATWTLSSPSDRAVMGSSIACSSDGTQLAVASSCAEVLVPAFSLRRMKVQRACLLPRRTRFGWQSRRQQTEANLWRQMGLQMPSTPRPTRETPGASTVRPFRHLVRWLHLQTEQN
jgi:hypothetical protein